MKPNLARIDHGFNRRERRELAAREVRQRRSGTWEPWRRYDFAKGSVGRDGWTADICEAWSNDLYAVLVRRLSTGVIHLAIRTPTNAEPPWRDMQRIKNELFGEEMTAVQVCPRQSRLIDAADMYHLWVLPEGAELGFGLSDEDEV